jgi:hypothetical protein
MYYVFWHNDVSSLYINASVMTDAKLLKSNIEK